MDFEKAKRVAELYRKRHFLEVMSKEMASDYRSCGADGCGDSIVSFRFPARWLPCLMGLAGDEMAALDEEIAKL